VFKSLFNISTDLFTTVLVSWVGRFFIPIKTEFGMVLLFLAFSLNTRAQQLGGNTVFNFINQPNSPQLAALGGVNISNITNDVSMSFANPALLRKQMNLQLNASFDNYFAVVKNYSSVSAWNLPKSNTNAALGINYFDYGSLPETDAAGNILGNFRPVDYVVQAMASHSYLKHWFGGITLKYISSNYGLYKSSGAAVDVGLSYYDSADFFQSSLVIKNLGTQLKTYDGLKEDLPFDIELGVTKKLNKAPIQFSLTAHHLQALNIYYNDTSFNNSIGYTGNNSAFKKIVSHLVFATQIFVSHEIELTGAYNFLNRSDLNVYNTANGLNGLTLGVGLYLKKIHIRYATGFYQQNMFHQIGLNIDWKGRMLN
jgi:hypothetical protein